MKDRLADRTRARIESALTQHPARRIPDEECDVRAAVALILSPVTAETGAAPRALFVRRAEVEGDPWSGHVALPGGRVDAEDSDLLDTARRETREETSLDLARADFLGRLDDIHPRSPHLPSVAVTPFVAWNEGPFDLRLNDELSGYLWVPLSDLDADANRGTLTRNLPKPRVFPTIEISGHTIWGMTWVIVHDFLSILEERAVE